MEISPPLLLPQVSRAPNRPGIYVWYGSLILGRADLSADRSLTNVLEKHSSRLTQHRLSVRAKLNFNVEWNGTLESGLRTASSEESPSPELSQASRDLIYEFLQAAQSQYLFFRPLYIGKAERSLRTRLMQHADEFLLLSEREPQLKGRPFEGEDNFAQRAMKLGYSSEQLVCFTLPVTATLSLPEAEVEKAISLVERYLNHWNTPLLGRR